MNNKPLYILQVRFPQALSSMFEPLHQVKHDDLKHTKLLLHIMYIMLTGNI